MPSSSYLVEGANWAEKVVWLVATVIAFTFASVWIERSYRDTKYKVPMNSRY